MEYPGSAWERAMRLQEVMLKAISGELHWFQAADILGMSPRGLRRWRERYERCGYDGLMDRRCGKPSIRRVPVATVEQILRLYRERYRGFNVRHFHQLARREHGVTVSYSFVKQALQTAGLVKTRRPRGRLGDAYGRSLRHLQQLRLIEWDDTGVRLSPGGRLLGNRVFREFV